MSMRDYAVNDYGLIMTRDMLKTICSKYCPDYTEEKYNDDEDGFNNDLYEAGIVEYISDFTGESIEISSDGRDIYDSGETYNNDTIYYMPVKKYSTLFKPAYYNMGEVVSEFKWSLHDYLPIDFDYKKYIRHIVGTYYG